jgi:hypothetical protein
VLRVRGRLLAQLRVVGAIKGKCARSQVTHRAFISLHRLCWIWAMVDTAALASTDGLGGARSSLSMPNTPNTRETAFGWVSVGPNPLNF